jgi:hypothetical protein
MRARFLRVADGTTHGENLLARDLHRRTGVEVI